MTQIDRGRALAFMLRHAVSKRMEDLPPWKPEMCDGCSVPWLFRLLIPRETTAERLSCCQHDQAYYYGGTVADRLQADLRLYQGLLDAGMPPSRADAYYWAVRWFGGPYWGLGEKRWSWGGRYYKYET